MSVHISVKGDSGTDEYKDALVLKEIFEKGIPNNIEGKILIISNATLFGQETKDVDIIALGSFEKFSLRIKSKAKSKDRNEEKSVVIDDNFEDRLVFIRNFCFVFETKKHRAEDIQLNGTDLLVPYKKNYKNVTQQSEKQKYSLKSFFDDRLNYSPYVTNFVWLRSVSWGSLKQLVSHDHKVLTSHNFLPNTFKFAFLMQLACVQNFPFTVYDDKENRLKGYSTFSSLHWKQNYDFDRIVDVFNVFEKVKHGVGELTRKKIEHITRNFLDNQQYAKAIGNKLVIISGKAGTGKTIRLLKIACDIAMNQGARCLILTYNLALVSDIKRSLALAEIPDGVDDYTVNITTLHKFIYELLYGFGIGLTMKTFKNGNTAEVVGEFLPKYNSYIKELHSYLEEGLIEESDINTLLKSNHDSIAWDYLLIDEAQDWSDDEKDVLFKIFGREKFIIADGIDQLVRTQKKCNWTRKLKPNIDFNKTHGRKGLRQKVNLVNFVNKTADKLNLNWEVTAKEELIGGKIYISCKEYDSSLHNLLFEQCLSKGNMAYEMMFLVPPCLVSRDGLQRNFKNSNEFANMDIHIWDGTNSDLRTEYPVDLNQHRLLQYESCRGLEGWTVVCLEFDQFVKYKIETYKEEADNELALESFEEKRDRFVNLWSLIPLTRAIDTLVITLKDRNSKTYKVFRELYEENPDYIQWIE